jgi:hypothetical protein
MKFHGNSSRGNGADSCGYTGGHNVIGDFCDYAIVPNNQS